jgi:GST-like protein
MIDLYTWVTPNGWKISIMLEETSLAYEVHSVNLSKDEQFKPEFLAISPNNKIPAIVDRDGPGKKPYSLFESGAILMYLAEKSGKLMPKEIGPRYEVVQWLIFRWAAWG